MQKKRLTEFKRMGHSPLWRLQEAGYTQYGVRAWTEKQVPFYLTSNPFTAFRYAQMAAAYLEECAIDRKKPVYFFDLGAGSGRLSYLFLKTLLPLLKEGITIRYILTDIVESNLTHLIKHPKLQKWFQEGILDVAAYSHNYEDEPLKLKHSGKILKKVDNPCILLANYYFDTVPQDLFRLRNHTLEEGHVALELYGEEGFSNPDVIDQMECSYRYHPIKEENEYYPGRPRWNALLNQYADVFADATFLFPVGALHTLDYFSNLSKKGYLLLAGDQGVTTEEQVRVWGDPQISLHGCFSFPVSYHLLSLYFEADGGCAFLPLSSDPAFVNIVGIKGAATCVKTKLTFFQEFDRFTPTDYWNLVEAVPENVSLDFLFYLLKLGRWDPVNFYAFFNQIRSRLSHATNTQKEQWVRAIYGALEHFFPISSEEGDFIHNLGILLFEMKRYQEALSFFEESLKWTGERALTQKNIEACHKILATSD